MARFYGTLQGQRGPTSRLGNTKSGLQVTAQSYQGDITVHCYALGEEDQVTITARTHGTSYARVCLYSGPVAVLLDPKGRAAMVQQFAMDALNKQAEGETQ